VILKAKAIALYSALMFLLFPYMVFAGEFTGYDDVTEGIHAAVGLQGWLSQANAKWQISFPYTTSTDVAGTIESRLDYRKIDSPVIVVTGRGQVAPQFAFDVVYGYGAVKEGRGTDTDRFLPSTGGGLEFSQSTNSLDGDTRLWGLNLYYFPEQSDDMPTGPWGLVLGYLYYGDSLRMTNGVQTVSVPFDGSTFPPVGPFSATQVLDSTFNFTWNMLKVGIVYNAEPVKGFSYAGTLAVYPYVDYEGEGYWNLRAGTTSSDFRLQSPNFIQKSKKGYGGEASLELSYDIMEEVKLSVGYRYMYVYTSDGTDIVYFASGSAVQSTLDWATATRHGAFAELSVKF
jgi:hypothetical protein